MGHNTNILKTVINTGKIYMKSELIDPSIGELGHNKNNSHLDNISIFTSTTNKSAMSQILKNNIKNMSLTRDNTANTRTEKYRSITEHTNEFLRKLKDRKEYTEDELLEDILEEVQGIY
jgi:hypothetical protein